MRRCGTSQRQPAAAPPGASRSTLRCLPPVRPPSFHSAACALGTYRRARGGIWSCERVRWPALTCRIRRNFMRFVLDDLPSYALGVRTADTRRQHTNLRKSHPEYWGDFGSKLNKVLLREQPEMSSPAIRTIRGCAYSLTSRSSTAASGNSWCEWSASAARVVRLSPRPWCAWLVGE